MGTWKVKLYRRLKSKQQKLKTGKKQSVKFENMWHNRR